MTRAKPLLKRGWALLLLPLSILPFVLLGPQIAQSHKNFDRVHKSGPLTAPPVVVSPAEDARWQPLPPFTGAVPVIVYKGLGSRELGQYLHYFPAFVVTAFCTDTMRHLLFMAVRTFRGGMGGKEVMCAATRGACF